MMVRFTAQLHENGGWFPKLLDWGPTPEAPRSKNLTLSYCFDRLADHLQKGLDLRHGEVIEFGLSFILVGDRYLAP